VRLFKAVFLMEMRNILAYRFSFLINFFGTTIGQLGLSYFLWSSIFYGNKNTIIGGMSFQMMILYSFLAPMTLKTVNGMQSLNINQDIYDGGLNKYIIYPLSYFQFKWIQQITHVFSHLFQLFVGLAIFALFIGMPPEYKFHSLNFLCFSINLFIASTLFFAMEAIMEMTAFWADNVWSLSVLLRFIINLLSGAWLSLTLFPQWSQELFYYLPFKGMVYSPVRILMGSMDYGEWIQSQVMMIVWLCLISLVTKKVWQRGNLRYTGVGI
jgi:ABC-2 type transport system permease protein